MNLKQILTPKTCIKCKFSFMFGGKHLYCGVGEFYLDDSGIEPCREIHKDCPLPRIKCENCKHYAHTVFDVDPPVVYCNKMEKLERGVCIEFEEVK